MSDSWWSFAMRHQMDYLRRKLGELRAENRRLRENCRQWQEVVAGLSEENDDLTTELSKIRKLVLLAAAKREGAERGTARVVE